MYFGKRYTSTVTGTVWRPVKCEHCMHEFAYQVQIRATGTGSSPYFLNNMGAQTTAESRAKAAFEKKVGTAYAAVPCPQCGHYQSDMIDAEKRKWTVYGIGTLISLVLTAYAFSGGEQAMAMVVLIWLIALIVAIVKKNRWSVTLSLSLFLLGVVATGMFYYLPDYAMPVTLGAGALFVAFAVWKTYIVDMNADPDKNRQKKHKHAVMPIKRNLPDGADAKPKRALEI